MQLFNSYRKNLVAIFTLIALVPVVLLSLFTNSTIKDFLVNRELKLKTQFIEYEADKFNLWLKDKEEILNSIRENYPFIEDMMNSEDDFSRVSLYLSKQLKSSQSFLNLYMAMKDGRKYNSAYFNDNIDTRERVWYKSALEKKDTVWTQPYKDLITGKIVITVSMPIFSEKGEFQGVIGGDFSLDDLFKKLEKLRFTDNSSLYIVDSENSVLYSSGKDLLNTFGLDVDNIQDASKFLGIFEEDDRENINVNVNRQYVALCSEVPILDWKIVSLTNKNDFYEDLNRIHRHIFYIVSATLLIVVLLAFLFAKGFSKPLEELKIGTIEIQKGNYDYRILSYNQNEFGQVAEAFNGMADKLKQSHEELKARTEKLLESNKQLQEINIELEASYEQLEATTSQLNESEEKYRTLIENMYDLVWVIDRNGNVIFINDHIEDLLNYDKKEIVGKHITELIGIWNIEGRDKDALKELKKRDYKNIEILFKTKDGKVIATEVNTKRIFRNGKIEAIQGVCRDITERKGMEKELLKRNTELSTINKISKDLNSTLELKELAQHVAENVVELMDIPLCTIRLLEDNKLKLIGKAGNLTPLIVNEDIDINEDVMGEAVKKRDIHVVQSSIHDNITKYNRKIIESNEFRFINFIPLKAREKVLGVLTVTTNQRLNASSFYILMSVANQTAMVLENINLYQGLKESYIKTIETLAAAVEAKDKYTVGHSLRVSNYAYMIAKHLNLSKEICEEIKIAGILHDIGKIGISDAILSKPGKLTEEEYNIITQHPIIGSKILENVGFSSTVMNAIKYHHKRYDLKGYPKDIDIEELPIEACIIGAADALDAMISDRSYRSALALEEAIEELIRHRGTQFHPHIIDTIIHIYKTDRKKLEEISKLG